MDQNLTNNLYNINNIEYKLTSNQLLETEKTLEQLNLLI